MDRWLPAHRKADGQNGPYCMGYYNRDDIPFQFALAEAFTVCDAYHCSVLGPTWPNRMYWFTGMIDPEGQHGGPILNNTAPKGGYTWTTYAERLEEAGIPWKVYQQEDNYGCNLLETFKIFKDAPKGSPLYSKAVLRGPEGQFEYDARNDKLPAVSWIIPTAKLMRSRPIPRCGQKPCSFSTTTKTTESLTMCRRRFLPQGPPSSS
jgi:phospholipase C